jgi:antibiotic biosynthesis monooxygenase (ABM) superfamily enzyme
MKRKALWAAVAVVLLAAVAFGQAQEQYLDVYIAQVKPEKRADFDAINKRMVAANRQAKGDTWIAMESVYGRGDRVTFISMRNSYADADKGSEMFNQALQKTYGKAAADKMEQDFGQCLANSRTELRRRRWDLSSNAPADAAAMAKMLANTRFLRTTTVRVKPGQVAAFEALLKDLKTAREKASPPQTALVSQAVAGQEGTVFYVTSLQNSMAGFDAIPSLQQILGEEGYEKFLKSNADVVESTETVINHFLPELSNAPEEVVAGAPDYWRPKTTMAARAGAAKSAAVNAAETGKVDDKNKH